MPIFLYLTFLFFLLSGCQSELVRHINLPDNSSEKDDTTILEDSDSTLIDSDNSTETNDENDALQNDSDKTIPKCDIPEDFSTPFSEKYASFSISGIINQDKIEPYTKGSGNAKINISFIQNLSLGDFYLILLDKINTSYPGQSVMLGYMLSSYEILSQTNYKFNNLAVTIPTETLLKMKNDNNKIINLATNNFIVTFSSIEYKKVAESTDFYTKIWPKAVIEPFQTNSRIFACYDNLSDFSIGSGAGIYVNAELTDDPDFVRTFYNITTDFLCMKNNIDKVDCSIFDDL